MVGAKGAQGLHGAFPGLTQCRLEPLIDVRFRKPVGHRNDLHGAAVDQVGV